MASVPVTRLTDVLGSLQRAVSAKEAVKEGIANHAQRHRAEMQEHYHELERQQRIAEGAARQNAIVPADH